MFTACGVIMSGAKKPWHRAFDDMTPAEKKIRWRATLIKRAEDQAILDEMLAELKQKNDKEHQEKLAAAKAQLETLANLRK